jgi:hypothetical protein
MSVRSLPLKHRRALWFIGLLAVAAVFAAVHVWILEPLSRESRFGSDTQYFLFVAWLGAFGLAFVGFRRFLGLPTQTHLSRIFRRRG